MLGSNVQSCKLSRPAVVFAQRGFNNLQVVKLQTLIVAINRLQPIGNLHYLVIPPGLTVTDKLPPWWGILQQSARGLRELRAATLYHITEQQLWHAAFRVLLASPRNRNDLPLPNHLANANLNNSHHSLDPFTPITPIAHIDPFTPEANNSSDDTSISSFNSDNTNITTQDHHNPPPDHSPLDHSFTSRLIEKKELRDRKLYDGILSRIAHLKL